MTKTRRRGMTGLAFTLVICNAGQTFATDGSPDRIVIRLDNYAAISRADESDTAATVKRIFAAAGIATVWTAVGDASDARGLHVRVLLLSREMARQKIARERQTAGIMGVAVPGAEYAYIFTNRIASMAARHGDYFPRLLGQVIAHEVGHLVLPIRGHAEQGIMRADLGVRSQRHSYFTTEQGVGIRARLAAADARKVADAMVAP